MPAVWIWLAAKRLVEGTRVELVVPFAPALANNVAVDGSSHLNRLSLDLEPFRLLRVCTM